MREGYGSCLVCVCVSVYPSVPALAASASVETSKQRYSFGFSWINVWSFEKNFRSKVMASNMQMSSPSAAFAQFRDQRNAAAT